MSNNSDDDLVKIAFHVKGRDGQHEITETMWALQQRDGTYVLDNSPFSAFDISHKDRVSAEYEDGMLTFTGVVERGGHSTYRVKLNEGARHEEFLKHWAPLALLGCTYEGSNSESRRLYSIDVPGQVAVQKVYDHLEKIEEQGSWEFEEAHYFS